MKYLLKLLSIAVIPVFMSGCGLLKSEYAPINYYRLMPQAPATNITQLPGTLMVRTFYTNAQYDSDAMYATTNGVITNPYEYHKWVSATPELVTDFIINRLSNYKTFSKGVVPSGSAAMPDYILEGKVLDMLAEVDERGASTVHLQIQVSLIKTNSDKSSVIMQKMYDRRINRSSNAIQSIAETMSVAISQVTDELASDMAIAVQTAGR